jgi:FlaA1/EpsC-like NDP-sugar epimerase
VDGFPRSVLLIWGLLTLLLLAGSRATWRTLKERPEAKQLGAAGFQQRLLLVGTLQEADHALRTLKGVAGWLVVGIVTPQAAAAGRTLQGVPVLGGAAALEDIARAHDVSTLLVAGAPGAELRREMLLRSGGMGLNLLTLPTAEELLGPDVVTRPRKVRLEDLLGRVPVQLDAQGLSQLLTGQTVLVTGAGGSIGSELCRQVARFGVARLVCVDVSELAIYQLEQQLRKSHPAMAVSYYTANVREVDRLRAIALRHRPNVVLHAAAYKHVPLMETDNEIEALRTNVLGTLNAARVAGEVGAARFVLISTDKAVNPTNVMGASKRVAEQVVQAAAQAFAGTRFVAVRFGNVLGSSGSVVPLFEEQLARGGPLTVTHPDIVRFFMTIPEATQLVLQASWMGQSGQIFVLDMGEPVKIVELARMMIRLSGKDEGEIPIAFTGLRPGEKLYEELLANDETTAPTPHPKLRVAQVAPAAADALHEVEAWVAQAGPAPTPEALRAWLQTRVPEYQPQPAVF